MTSLGLIWFGAFLAVWSLWRYMSIVWVSRGSARSCNVLRLTLSLADQYCHRHVCMQAMPIAMKSGSSLELMPSIS